MKQENFVKKKGKLTKQKEKVKHSKFVRKSLELLLSHATTEKDFKVLAYSISDYSRQGYDVVSFVGRYHEAYKRWKRINEGKE